MKITIKHFLVLCLMLVVQQQAFSQVQAGRKYRVIAYKKGDLTVQSVSNEVTIIPAMTFYIPNTFTPNGDGLNDTFGVSGEAINDFSMKIFNRWGKLIYETTNPNQRWDGRFEGEISLEGTYAYVITAKGPTGNRQTRHGNFNLVM